MSTDLLQPALPLKPPPPVWEAPVNPAVPRSLCTDCGISRSSEPKRCASACQFIQPDYAKLEQRVHGRVRDAARPDELFFGPHLRMLRAAMRALREGAQWTGITTRIAERLLETGTADTAERDELPAARHAHAQRPKDGLAQRPVT